MIMGKYNDKMAVTAKGLKLMIAGVLSVETHTTSPPSKISLCQRSISLELSLTSLA